MDLNQIWAKDDGTKLLEHTEATLKVFKSLRNSYTNVPDLCRVENFWELLFVSLFLHDLGKSALGFQKSLRTEEKWPYRHEILSASFISTLRKYTEFEKTAISLAIIGHHKDLSYIKERYATYPESPGTDHYRKRINELFENIKGIQEFLTLLPEFSSKYLEKKLPMPYLPKKQHELLDSYKNLVLKNYIIPYEDGQLNCLHGLFGKYLKGFMTACDHLASGHVYRILNIPKNIKKLYNFESFRVIQNKAMRTKGDALLTAPTGTGKTESALFWADNNQNKNSSKRIYYVLPYTASINAMYERLSEDFKRSDLIGLLHGKASYYFYKALSGDSNYKYASTQAQRIKNLSKKIYRPVKILTPYQILKAFFGIKGFEQNLSEMTNGLFILDEIHTYDPHTTSLIIEMLKIIKSELNGNILIMSATIPTFLKNTIKNELGIYKEIKFSENKLKNFSRHKVVVLPGNINKNYDKMRKDIEEGKRVLVVCNTVKKAQTVYKELAQELSNNTALIHGRFTLRDREKIENKLNNLNLLVGTQAIEVSLNISYDVLYTEPAPIDALIQRFGRVNRKGWEKQKVVPVYVFEEGSENDKFIYNQELIKNTIIKLKEMENKDKLNEVDVQNLVDEVYDKGYTKDDMSEFNKVKKHFVSFYKKNVPFIENRHNRTNFYSLFNAHEIVPYKYKDDYQENLNSKKYFEAMSYFTSISEGQYRKLKGEDRVISIQGTDFVDSYYDSTLGLILSDKTEKSIFI